jgi:hypothetical protein
MELSKQAILDKTHYGIKIYAFVLEQYYQDETVLSLRGRNCLPAKNPFNNDKPTLMITIEEGCAMHYDTDNAIEKGDVFDFAALHFQLEEQELYHKLNEVLFLKVDKPTNSCLIQQIEDNWESLYPMVKEIKPPIFSYFNKPITNTVPNKEISLVAVYQLIKGNTFQKETEMLTSLTDPKEVRKYKALNFNYVTFSGIFSKRNESNLINHSGLLTIDLDHISEMEHWKNTLLQDPYFETELLFISPSGNGLKWIITIDLLKAKHQDNFKAVANYLKFTYQLEVDQSGKDCSRACFLPYDPTVYINPKYVDNGKENI